MTVGTAVSGPLAAAACTKIAFVVNWPGHGVQNLRLYAKCRGSISSQPEEIAQNGLGLAKIDLDLAKIDLDCCCNSPTNVKIVHLRPNYLRIAD